VGTERALRAALLLVPVLAWAVFAFVDPRPFYLAEDDGEAITLYSARLVETTGRPIDLHMPGLTTAYAAAASGVIAGAGPQQAGARLIGLRFVAALLTGLALFAVARFTFSGAPVAVTAVALSPVVAWPSFLFYFDYFDPLPLQQAKGLL
jgi:hypothetical protein